jgi:hypothetical protein
MTQTPADKQDINLRRRRQCYEIVKALAQAEGVPIPRKNLPEDGAAFDAWLEKKLESIVKVPAPE